LLRLSFQKGLAVLSEKIDEAIIFLIRATMMTVLMFTAAPIVPALPASMAYALSASRLNIPLIQEFYFRRRISLINIQMSHRPPVIKTKIQSKINEPHP